MDFAFKCEDIGLTAIEQFGPIGSPAGKVHTQVATRMLPLALVDTSRYHRQRLPPRSRHKVRGYN